MRGEVMWPRLVASKLLRKTLGSNNFVADLPGNTYSFLDLPTLDLEPVPSSTIVLTDHHDTRKFKLFVSTWNVGGVAPTEDINIDELLDTYNTTCDIYVLGFQEVVPLRASNVLGSDKTKTSTKWNSLIRKALNKKSYDRYYKSNNLSSKQQHVTKSQKSDIESSMIIQPEFRCLISKQMVGIMISVWVRSDLHPFFRNPSVSCVGCGIMGCLGNKGSVSVRFQFHETSFCFVCCHLASGGREGDEKIRNSNVVEILSRTCFPTTMGPTLDMPKSILDHDRIVLLGDLNYRISLPERDTRLLVNQKDWNTLLENDQLLKELMDGEQFEAWHEGTISFAPTYKYQLNCDEYYGCGHIGAKGKKKRAPAWCDRIIWTGEGLKQLLYTRIETRLSDHRPVKAMFSTEVKVSRIKYQSICLSHRFGQRPPNNNIDFHSDFDDEYSYHMHSDRLSFHIKNKMTP